MDQFFRSVAKAFEANRQGSALAAQVALALGVLLLAWLAAARLRRKLARGDELRQHAAKLGLTPEQREGATSLARRHGADPLTFLTHLEVFERVTAQALAGVEARAPQSPLADLIRGLRVALGFDRLPAFFPLLTTRELSRGLALDVAGLRGEVARVDERGFAVEVHGPLPASPGQTIALSLAHAREARYSPQCVLQESAQVRPDLWVLVFAHDEAPARVQRRDYARVPTEGPVRLRLPAPAPGGRGRGEEVEGRLVDVSAGGLQLLCKTRFSAGSVSLASFELGGARFHELRAIVLSSEATPAGPFDVRLEFHDLSEHERERMVTAVARAAHPELAAGCARPVR